MKTHAKSDTLCPSSSRVPPPPLYVLSLGRLSIDDVLALASSLLGPRMALFCLSRSTAALLLTNCALLFTPLSMIIVYVPVATLVTGVSTVVVVSLSLALPGYG